MTLIKDDDDLLGTVNSHIKLRRLRARRKTKAADSRYAKASRGRTKKDKDLEDSNTSSDVPRLRRRDRAAASQLKKTRDEEELAKAKKEKEEKELTDAYILYFKELSSNNSGIFANAIGMGKTRAMVLAVLIGHVYFKNWTEVQNAQAEGNATEYNAVNDDDKLFAMDLANSMWCDLSDPLALQFCFFSNSPLENIGRLTKEEAIEMRINTTNAISKALAAANKLVAPRSYTILEANTPAVHSKATKHRLALLAARFIIVCSFRKVDKHVFRAYNTISVTAQRTIIRKGGPYVEKRAILLPSHITALSGTPIEQGLNKILIFVSLALISLQNRKGRDSVTSDRIYKIEDAVYRSIAEILSHRTPKQWRNIITNVKHDASEHESSYNIKSDFLPYFQSCLCSDFLSTVQNAKQQCRDILEKEGLNKSEASRRVIFNRFEMQAIASYPALATLKAAQFKTYSSCKVKCFTLNSVKDLFTNLSKDYFLVREARAITKSSSKFQNLSNLCSKSIAAEDAAKAANTLLPPKEVCAKILIESYKPIVQAIIVASIVFAEAIILIEATHVVIIELQDSQLAEIYVGIVYFNPDSKLELKVLGKQDVKTTSRDKLQGRGSTVTDQRID
ncbi:hypothetical protein HBH89_009380 [Parastagonospora nodorum]|nr:hypothetical protein HBH89_009380 [Parastagonospora nodorum]